MKKLFILFIGLTQSLIAQDIVFKENFDLPSGGDSVSSYGLIPTTNIWKDTSFLAHSGTQSGMGVTEQLNTVFLQTDAFSTLGKKNVVLEFDHIAKLHFFRHGKVEISVDSGSTWVQTDTAGYYGNSPNFKTLNYFNEISYPVQSMSPYWGGPTITPPGSTPTNSWWAHETFDISDVAGIVQPNGDTGYANVMVRFSIVHNNGPQFATGWLIDDIKVTGSKCELVKPQISFNTIPQYFPNGPVYLQNQRVDVMVSDNEGLDSVAVTYRENGGPWMRMLMTPLSFLNCGNGPHSVQFKYDFLNIAVGDTIDYFITAYDCSCPNSAQEPIGSGNYHTFFREPALPTKCGVTYPGSFPNVIYNFPWIEDFEDPNYWVAGTGSGHTGITHRGSFPTVNPPVGLNWKVAPNPVTSGFAWSVRDQPTVTTNTGPNQNHTPNGSTFIYTEGSQGSNNSSTQFITPCIDLSNVACPQVEFYYHMYGNDINRLVLLVDTGIHAYAWTPAIWKHLGGDQTSSSDPWKRVVVSLEEFKGKIITLNFLGRRGNGEKSDIAIDDVKIFDAGSSVDFVLSELTNPIESNCTYSNNEAVTFHVKQIGCTPVYKLPLAYAITDSSSGLTTTVWDTLFNPLGGEIDSVFSFSTPADLSNYGLFGLKVFSNYSGDIDKVSDTIAPITIEHNGYVSFPYFSDFDDSPWVPGDGTTNSPGVMDSSHFIALAGANAQYRWVVSKNNTPEYNTGPARDYSGNGNYLVTVGGSGYNAATYISKCIDIPATGNPVITFMSYLHGSNIQSLLVQAKEDGGNWQSLPGGAITPWTSPQGPAFDPWTFNERSLFNYKGKKIRIRILGIGYQNSFANIAIDNLSIHNQITNDVGIIDMVQPNHFQETPVSNGNIQLIVGNFGMALQFATPVTVDLIPKCGGNTITHTGSTSLTILSNSTGLLNISTNSFPNGDYTLKAYTTLTGDSINFNDTLYRDVTVRNPINVSNGY
ncbi:MAG: hypothetical protein N4A46_15990, partial [Schleiferiaceae bacterium]|nr:hypothetical protein [Schleiferiaceae bacterium]